MTLKPRNHFAKNTKVYYQPYYIPLWVVFQDGFFESDKHRDAIYDALELANARFVAMPSEKVGEAIEQLRDEGYANHFHEGATTIGDSTAMALLGRSCDLSVNPATGIFARSLGLDTSTINMSAGTLKEYESIVDKLLEAQDDFHLSYIFDTKDAGKVYYSGENANMSLVRRLSTKHLVLDSSFPNKNDPVAVLTAVSGALGN